MPRISNFPPLRPKRPGNESIPEPLHTPQRPLSPANYQYAPEVLPTPTFMKAEPTEHSPTQLMDLCPTQPALATSPPNAPSGEPMQIEQTPTLEAAPLEHPLQVARHSGDGYAAVPLWPSEIQRDTVWLLPPCPDQASTLALLLRTKIQSHNITRETLHMTEQRRLESVLNCNQLHTDVQSWSAAYNNMATALRYCSEEYSRLLAENVELKANTQAARVWPIYA
jgi:hypothetical protein